MRPKSRGGRTDLSAVVAGLALSFLAGAGQAVAAPAAPADFNGVWALDPALATAARVARPGPRGLLRGWKGVAGWKTNGNVPPPLRPSIYTKIRKDQAVEKAGAGDARAAACKPASAFDLLTVRAKVSIFQTREEVAMIIEGERAMARHIYFGREHPPLEDITPSTNGHSVAHWEGAVLVVDTVAIDPGAYLNSADFIPQSEKLHVVERLRLDSAGALLDTMTVEDPQVFTRPWTIHLRYRKMPSGTRLTEAVCDFEKARAGRH